jgi:hypothetical protein
LRFGNPVAQVRKKNMVVSKGKNKTRPQASRRASADGVTAPRSADGHGHARAETLRSLARQVNRSPSAVRKWMDRSDWPFSRTGPWDVVRVRAWMDIQLKPDPAAAYRKRAKAAEAGTGEFHNAGPLEKARIQATIERALYIRQKRLAESGELHSKADCDRHRLQQIMEVRNRLMDIPRSMASGLSMQTAEVVEQILDRAMRAILDEFGAKATPVEPGGDDGQ